MAFCPACGAAVEGRFCAKCGAAVGAAPGMGTPPAAGPPPPPAGGPVGGQTVASTGLQENVASALCYLVGLITGIIFLVLAPYNQNRTIKFHAFQSIFFNVAWIAFWFALMILHFILPWGLSLLLSLLSLVIWLGGFVLWLMLMWKAYNNQKFKLPVIGDLAEKQA